jgi:hypothetical protein
VIPSIRLSGEPPLAVVAAYAVAMSTKNREPNGTTTATGIASCSIVRLTGMPSR